MEDCIFCQVIRGELPTTKLFENDRIIVIKDIHPVSEFHVLAIPKDHIDDFHNVRSNETYLALMSVLNKMIEEHGLMGKGYRIETNGGGAQIIDHLHMHLISPFASHDKA